MSEPSSGEAFFVGYLAMPKRLGRYLAWAMALIFAILIGAGAGFLLGMSDPGDGRFRGDLGVRTFNGPLTVDPYPALHLEGDQDHPEGRTILLIGSGKFGVDQWADPLDGRRVEASGILISHNAYEMLVIGNQERLVEVEKSGTMLLPEPENIGGYTLTGEIVDSKCAIGAMHPGNGKAHKGCANLCLTGQTPAMFMVHGPKGAFQLFLLTGPDGGRIADQVSDEVGLFVEATGTLVRRGGLVEFRIDPASVKLS